MDLTCFKESVKDASAFSMDLIRYEKSGNLNVMTDAALKTIVDGIVLYGNEETLKNLGSTDIPTEQGVYRAVLAITDACNNVGYEEIYIILDKQSADFADTAAKLLTTTKDKLNDKPPVNPEEYIVSDNVDGSIKAEQLQTELVLKESSDTQVVWSVLVSYTDRSGNTGSADYEIVVKAEKPVVDNTPDEKPSTGTTDNSNTQKPDETPSTGTTTTPDTEKPDNTPSSGTTQAPDEKPSTGNGNVQYDPADTDKDGTVSTSEGMAYITPEKQACIDAGYGVVCEFFEDDGEHWIAVMCHSDGLVDGRSGADILSEWLDSRGWDARSMTGHVTSYDKDLYWYEAHEVYDAPTPDDEDFWDEENWD